MVDMEQPEREKQESPERQNKQEKEQREAIRETGEVTLHGKIHLLSVIGEIDCHNCLRNNNGNGPGAIVLNRYKVKYGCIPVYYNRDFYEAQGFLF